MKEEHVEKDVHNKAVVIIMMWLAQNTFNDSVCSKANFIVLTYCYFPVGHRVEKGEGDGALLRHM